MGRGTTWIIEDISIGSQDDDRFDHAAVAREIADISRASRHSLAIGLLGRYGTGKSSVVRLLQEELGSHRSWAVLQVSAERHTGVARGRGLLYGLMDEARRQGDSVLTKTAYMALRAKLEGAQQRTTTKVATNQDKADSATQRYAKAVLWGFAWMIFLSAVVWGFGAFVTWAAHAGHAWPHIKTWTWFATSGSTAPTAFLLSGAVAAAIIVAAKDGILKILSGYEITLNTPKADTTDELEQAFLDLIRKVKRRVVVAIDDIDRLAAADVLEALSMVRSLLLVGAHFERPPIFLLSCDEDVVREAIIGVRPGLAHRPIESENEKEDSRGLLESKRRVAAQAADEYLNKLFTVRISLPNHYELDMREYAESLLRNHPINAKLGSAAVMETVLDVLIHDQVRDPRHVIRLINGFLAHYRVAERREANTAFARIAKGEVTKYPIELARLTVLQYDFRSLFEEVRQENELLHLLDDVILSGTVDPNVIDPLVIPYLKIVENYTEGQRLQLDYERHTGLAYMRRVAPTVRPYRAPHIGPLIALGSEPDSRYLGSEIARAIRDELQGRDVQGFADRLQQADGRTRVLQAAEITVNSARHGLALDNTLATTVGALSLQMHAINPGEVVRLADTIARRRNEMTVPLRPSDLAILLQTSSSPHHGAIAAELRHLPQDPQDRRDWADVVLPLTSGPFGNIFTSSLDEYFREASTEGGPADIDHWVDAWNQDPDKALAMWPASAYSFLLSCMAQSGDDRRISEIAPLILRGAEHAGWTRSIVLGLLNCLGSTQPLRRLAVSILQYVEVPEDEWGLLRRDDQTLPKSSTVALHLTDEVADELRHEHKEKYAVEAAKLLYEWLPQWVQTSNDAAIELTRDVFSETAHTSPILARRSGMILSVLPEEHAAAYVISLTDNIDPSAADSEISSALRDTLVSFLRATAASELSVVQEAANTILLRLTDGLEADSPGGTFARQSLPYVLSTEQGRERAAKLAERLINAIPPRATNHALQITGALHLIFLDEEVMKRFLASSLSKVQQWTGYGEFPQAIGFAARYAAEPAVGDQWLIWAAQNWASLPQEDRKYLLRAAGRQELSLQHPVGSQLTPLLVNELGDTSTTEESWVHAIPLWPAVTDDQRSQLLATERGRCPRLAELAYSASEAALFGALQRSGDQLERVLEIIDDAPAAAGAINQFVIEHMESIDWLPKVIETIITYSANAEDLWQISLATAHEGRDAMHRAATVIRMLADYRAGTVPSSFAEDFATLVHSVEDEKSAEALGSAVAPLPKVARFVASTLVGSNNTSSEQKKRNTAFKRGAGIQRRRS